MFLALEALSILEVGGVQAEVQHGADLDMDLQIHE